MWIVCLADDSLEMSNLFFLKKKIKKLEYLLQILLGTLRVNFWKLWHLQDEEDVKPFLLIPGGQATPVQSFPNTTLGVYPQHFRKSRSKINDELRREIVKFYIQNPNMNQGEIADMFGIDRTTVSKLLKRKHEYLDAQDEIMLESTKKSKISFNDLYHHFDTQRITKQPRKSNRSGKYELKVLNCHCLVWKFSLGPVEQDIFLYYCKCTHFFITYKKKVTSFCSFKIY